MKKAFSFFSEKSETEIGTIWKEAIFVFDTNILLNIFKYKEEDREGFFNIMEQLKDQLWIPFQVGYEFHTNFNSVISSLFSEYDKLEGLLKSSKKSIDDKVNQLKNNNSAIDFTEETIQLKGKFDEMINFINEKKEKHKENFDQQSILDKIYHYYNGKTGYDFSKGKLEETYQEAELRFSRSIPPGYKDKEKPNVSIRNKCGDYIIWKQMIEYAQKISKPFIFVTNDQKEDWFEKDHSKKFIPRVELLLEFKNRVKGEILIYPIGDFMKSTRKYLSKDDLTDETIYRIEEVNKPEVDLHNSIDYFMKNRRNLFTLSEDNDSDIWNYTNIDPQKLNPLYYGSLENNIWNNFYYTHYLKDNKEWMKKHNFNNNDE